MPALRVMSAWRKCQRARRAARGSSTGSTSRALQLHEVDECRSSERVAIMNDRTEGDAAAIASEKSGLPRPTYLLRAECQRRNAFGNHSHPHRGELPDRLFQ